MSGLDLPAGNLRELLEVDVAGWKKEVEDTAASYARYDNKLPKTLSDQLDGLRKRLG
jgi:GTP-dependent phosphoenolpyruvate carboxykinase